jgi:hypothetical protein
MQSNLTRSVIGIALLICLMCPLVEMFDHWDNTLQTGNDTEYALVILCLCVGTAFSFARLILTIGRRLSSDFFPGISIVDNRCLVMCSPIASPGSPPISLRI